MEKLLLLAACLVVPGVWGLLLSQLWLRYRPFRNGRTDPDPGPEASARAEAKDADSLAADAWFYQI